MSRWHRHDALLRSIDRRHAAESTPLHIVPVLILAAAALLVWHRIRRVTSETPVQWIGAASEAPRREAV